MRHLSVPKSITEVWLSSLRSHGWLVDGAGITAEGEMRLLPLTESAPPEGDDVWQGHAVLEREALTRGPSHWAERLPSDVPADLMDALPSSYEIMGDVLLVKLETPLKSVAVDIATAMLAHLPNVRVVCEDHGVHGTFRVRHLEVLAGRDGATSTQTSVREFGLTYRVDPAKVYYSARLGNERRRSAAVLAEHASALGRPLVVFDPYAGVGPNLGLPVTEGHAAWVVAGDLNPDAMPLLQQNLEHLVDRARSSVEVTLHGGDGRAWREHAPFLGAADAVFVNLPHDAASHLADLVPLLADDAVMLGWSIADRDTEADLNAQVRDVLEVAGRRVVSLHVEAVKGYSTTLVMHRLVVRSTTGS